jgi:alcohol dehydrogenase (cytochrome c)
LLGVLDRDTHNVLYSTPITTRENAEGRIGPSFTHVCQGLLGGHEWNGAAYSPLLGALFVPATDWCNQIRPAAWPPDPQVESERGQFFGGEFQFDPWANARGRLTALDAATGALRWQYQSSKPLIGGVAVTGGTWSSPERLPATSSCSTRTMARSSTGTTSAVRSWAAS